MQLFIGLEYDTGDKGLWDLVLLLGGVFVQIFIANIYRENREACCCGSVQTEKLEERNNVLKLV